MWFIYRLRHITWGPVVFWNAEAGCFVADPSKVSPYLSGFIASCISAQLEGSVVKQKVVA